MRSTSPALVSLIVSLSGSLLACAAPEAPDELDTPSSDATIAAPTDQETAPVAPAVSGPAVTPPRTVVPTSIDYPAPHPGMPQIPSNGGVVLHAPAIVTVTFPGDRYAAQLGAFGDQVGSLDWWSTVHAGYGVGPATGAGHVAIADAPPAALTDVDVEAWLAARIGDGTLPAPTDQTIYTLYYPQSTTITFSNPQDGGAASCQVFLGYHSTINVTYGGSSIPIAYAVINRCADDLDQLTVTASHEFTEASTDPHPTDDASCGYVTLTDNAWTELGGENADMCAGVSSVTEAGWALTRVWNNLSAAAGDQPCQPAPDTGGLPYYNAGIVDERLVVHRGASASTEVDCYSFGSLPSAMSLSAAIPAQDPIRIAFDKKTCTNGDKVTMTVSVGADARHGTDYHYTLYAGLGSKSAHLWRGMVHVP